MKRRHVLALLGFFSLGGAAVAWRLLASFRRPDAREHIARSIAAIADVMFPGDGLASAASCGSTSAPYRKGGRIFWRLTKQASSRPSTLRSRRMTMEFSPLC